VTQPGRLSGLLTAVLADKSLREALGAVDSPRLELEGPPAGRPLLVSALATERPVLAITATGREADELGAIAKDLLGPDAVELFPSWETLPHERLSPRADTVGRRLEVLRRLAHPEEHPAGQL
jgi:transcription-repair coupling factor (superfamily II helicase)